LNLNIYQITGASVSWGIWSGSGTNPTSLSALTGMQCPSALSAGQSCTIAGPVTVGSGAAIALGATWSATQTLSALTTLQCQ
jgi:hypothetical protein